MRAWLEDGRIVLMSESLREHEAIRAFVGRPVEQGEIAIPGVGTTGGCFIRLCDVWPEHLATPALRGRDHVRSVS